MAHKTAKPAQPRQAVTGFGWNSLAASDRIDSAPFTGFQADFAVRRLAACFGLSAATASAVASANAWGRP